MKADSGDTLWCEQCGEAEQTVSLAWAGLCEGCAEQALAEELEPVLGYKPCATTTWHGNQKRLCLVEWGTEHSHA